MIEDEDSLATAIEYQLTRQGYAVTRSSDGESGLRMFASGGVDLVLLDLMLPKLPGEDVCRAIRKTSSVPIIMLTAKDTEIERVLGLELGADDYVTKPFSTPELLARVKAVLRRSRQQLERPRVWDDGRIRLDVDRFEAWVDGELIHLPRKEFELLHLLMENSGRVLTRATLIDRVWGVDYYGDTRTLDVHIKRLREKLEADPHKPERLVTVRGIGYKFQPSPTRAS